MFNADRAELVTFDPGGRGAVTQQLDPGRDLVSGEPRDLDPATGVWGRVLLDRQAVLLTSPIEDPALREHFDALGIEDAMIAPVFGRGTDDVVGAICVFNSRGDVGTFAVTGLRLLETVAHQVAVSLENSRLIDELRAEAAVRRHQALHDPLTDLPNRRALLERLDQALDAAVAEPCGALVLLNLDGFQHVNDTLGHGAGDALLVEVASRLRSAAGDSEFVARIGGDEFVVLRIGSAPEGLALDLLSAVGAPLRLAGIPIEVTASAGRVRWPDDGADGVTLLRRADVAMRLAKSARSGVEDYRPERDGFSPERLQLIGEFRGALAEGQLFLVYQPKVSLATGAVTGVEALIRWQHPERGLVPPNEFIPYVEHTALIMPMTEWVIEEAVRQLAAWRAAGHGFSVSVNVPARHVDAGTTLGGLGAFLEGRGIPADRLVLEITESGIMADPRGAQEVLASLRAAGFGISIDDFGTGFSSLSRLKDLPVTELKIDRSFVMQLTEDANADTIVRSTIELGHLLGLHVVAEGVETVDQLGRLRALGCDTVQGFLFSRPLPPAELEAWIESQAALQVVPIVR
jgi:diguanylate cyclase (GGDEF)-like protein